MQHVVDLADVALALDSPGPLAVGVAHLIEHLPPAATPADVGIRHVDTAPPRPARAPDHAVERFDIWVDDGAVVIADVTGACARLGNDTVEIGGGGEGAANGFHALFLFAVTHLLAGRQRYVLHGGAIVDNRGARVVLGGSGSGKSTLAAAALAAGWRVLGDDMVVLRRRPSGLDVCGVPRTVAVPGEVASGLAGTPMEFDPRGRLAVSPACLTAGWFPVTGVILVGHDDTPDGTAMPADPQEVVRMAVASFASAVNPRLLRPFLGPAAALGRIPGRHVRHGSEPASRLAATGHLLAAG